MTRKAIALMTLKETPVLRFNQEDDSDRTTFFGITLTAAINVHGAFPKSDRFVAGLALGNAPYKSGFHDRKSFSLK
ncbi:MULTISPECIES: hypothetical protein [unclassified Microcystis]|uniref:hypothetical protein n=2 Tax=Microcystis TaxID=1125 RepID=UPI0003085512|nr:hypothetical protein [Microcystis sp. T1-4]